MSRKILFFLSSENFHAHTWNNGALSEPYYFSHNAAGLERFAEFLQTHRYPAYLLVDLIEEDFRQETVPHLTGSNHQALVQRKFEQYYRNTPFRLTRLQQRQTEGRRDDELLFSALTNPAHISAWLALLLLYQTPLAGIYSIPHTSTPLIKDIDSDHLLLLSWEKDSGLRQSYFLNKRLRFSRLTPINANSSFAEAIATESVRTRQYLHSLSLTPHGQLLDAYVICHAQDRSQLDAQLTNNPGIQFAYLDLPQLGKQFKSKHNFVNSDATPLFVHLLAAHPPRNSYATAEHSHYFSLWQTRRGLFALAAATAVTCVVWSLLSLIGGGGVNDEIEIIKNQTNRMAQETHQITQKFPNGSASNHGSASGTAASTGSATDMKTAVTLFRNLQLYSVPPEKILQGLSTTLDSFPRISSNKLEWKLSAGASLPEQVITFNGELADFGSDYRGAINYLDRFQLALTKAEYSVSPIKLPLDFSSKGSISADINTNRDKPAEFSLKIIWRPKP